jgi:hypothetical protein
MWVSVKKDALSEILPLRGAGNQDKDFRTYYMKKAVRKKEEGQTFSPIRRCSPVSGRTKKERIQPSCPA